MKPPMKQGSPIHFQTPEYGVEPLLPYLKKNWTIVKLQSKLTKHLPEEDYLSEMCKSAEQIISDHFEGIK